MLAARVVLALASLSASADREPSAIASPPLELTGAGRCPSAEGVAAELQRVMTSRSDGEPGRRDRAEIRERPEGFQVRLSRADGQLVAERSIATAVDCDERATMVAVVLATWEAGLRSDVVLDLQAIERAPAPEPFSPSLGAALIGVASAAGSWTGGAALDLGVARRAGWGLGAGAWGSWYRSVALGDGRARWARWAMGLGPSYAVDLGAAAVIARAQAAVGQLFVAGEGFSTTHRDSSLDWGARAGLEVAPRRAAARPQAAAATRLVPVLGLDVAVWPRRQDAVATGVAATGTLPAVDLLLSLGLRWERTR